MQQAYEGVRRGIVGIRCWGRDEYLVQSGHGLFGYILVWSSSFLDQHAILSRNEATSLGTVIVQQYSISHP